MTYREFLENKIDVAPLSGLEIQPDEISPELMPHQRDCVLWALCGSRRALFAAFGLGKTVMQLEWAKIVAEKTGGNVLIVLPLNVRREFVDDAERVLHNKLVNTATPSPNRYKELIHYAGFLEIMDTGQALTRWFKRDSTKANNLTLYPGREREFWIWCASWGLFLQKPSDLGYSDDGYSLPPLDVRYHRLQTELSSAGCEPDGQMKLMRDAAFGLRDAAREKRESIDVRVAEAKHIAELMAAPVSKLQAMYRKYSWQHVYSYDEHVALAKQLDADGRLPATFMVCAPGSWTDSVWDDINRMRTLNTSQRLKKRELHICPLQLDVVERAIERWSNPGDLILDPFGGLMTVPYTAVTMGRRGAGIELNSDYFRDGVGYLEEADEQRDGPTLFDLVEVW